MVRVKKVKSLSNVRKPKKGVVYKFPTKRGPRFAKYTGKKRLKWKFVKNPNK